MPCLLLLSFYHHHISYYYDYYYYSHLHVARRRSFFYSCSTISLLTIPILSILSVFRSSSLIPTKGFDIHLLFSFYFIFLSLYPPISPSLPESPHYHHYPFWHFKTHSHSHKHPQSLPTRHDPQATNSTSLLQVLQPSEHSVFVFGTFCTHR